MNNTQLLGVLNDALISAIACFHELHGSRPDSIYLTTEQKELITAIYGETDTHIEGSITLRESILGLTIKELPQTSVDGLPPNTCLISLDSNLKPEDQFQECISLDLSLLFKD